MAGQAVRCVCSFSYSVSLCGVRRMRDLREGFAGPQPCLLREVS